MTDDGTGWSDIRNVSQRPPIDHGRTAVFFILFYFISKGATKENREKKNMPSDVMRNEMRVSGSPA